MVRSKSELTDVLNFEAIVEPCSFILLIECLEEVDEELFNIVAIPRSEKLLMLNNVKSFTIKWKNQLDIVKESDEQNDKVSH